MFNIYNKKQRKTVTVVLCIVLAAVMVLTTVLAAIS